MKNHTKEALEYHSSGRPGKIQVVPTKPFATQRDLSLAYSPGVADPCLEIARDPELVNKYTAKGNLVAVISNGTAVLGLGNIGPLASKPVMEGKGMLFKIYADIDVFDIELDANDVEKFITVVKALEPTFGGINLEDIKSPECFEIEQRLKEELNIPVMHDDQHGTAIILGAALLNSLEIIKKKISKINIVVSGAGASAISCMKIMIALGAKAENMVVLDSHGIIKADRKNLEEIKKPFATKKKINTLTEALKGADLFVGLSKAKVVTGEMIMQMSKDPIIFALANPDPEIDYASAIKARPDAIVATGRSDFPNQVNNVLGFPYIFRGALDVRATSINEEMKLAAVYALADLAKKPVPDMVSNAYGKPAMAFGKDYIIPKPIDPRLISTVAPAVAKAAMDSGVAKLPITDWELYENTLLSRIGVDNRLTRAIVNRAKSDPKRVIFAEADNPKTLKAAQIVRDEGIAIPILLGNLRKIKELIKELGLDFKGVEMIDPFHQEKQREKYAKILYERRKRRGITMSEAIKLMRSRNYFGCAMIEAGEADALISGMTRKYPDTIRPALQLIGSEDAYRIVAGMYIMITKKGPFFFADTTVNINPTAEDLVKITELTAQAVKDFNVEPRIALLSYANFGSADMPDSNEVARAVKILQEKHPDWIIDGEVQANIALNPTITKEFFNFTPFADKPANTLIFPNLAAGNIAYKMLQEIGEAEAIGPVLLGLKKSIHILQLGSSVREIVNMVAIAVADAQRKAF